MLRGLTYAAWTGLLFPCIPVWLCTGLPLQSSEKNLVTVGAFYFASLADATWLLLVAFDVAVSTLLASCSRVNSRVDVDVWARAWDVRVPSLLLELGPRTWLEKATWEVITVPYLGGCEKQRLKEAQGGSRRPVGK